MIDVRPRGGYRSASALHIQQRRVRRRASKRVWVLDSLKEVRLSRAAEVVEAAEETIRIRRGKRSDKDEYYIRGDL